MKLLQPCPHDNRYKCALDMRCSEAQCKIWEKTHPKKDETKKIEEEKDETKS